LTKGGMICGKQWI